MQPASAARVGSPVLRAEPGLRRRNLIDPCSLILRSGAAASRSLPTTSQERQAMDDRYSRYGQRDYSNRGQQQDYGRDYGSGRDYTHSSARDYAAAGESRHEGRDRSRYGAQASRDDDRWSQQRGGGEDRWGPQSRGGWDRDRSFGGGDRHQERERSQDRDWGGRSDHDSDRGFFERAGDEVRSWFGDEEAERRRERDQRYDQQLGRHERQRDAGARDDHYHSWRRQRIAELDRDYDEYRQENAQRFESEFTSWRTERQGQRDCLGRVNEHMEVVGSDGSHVGTVDKVRGDRIILTKNDADAGGHHHSIPSRWIDSVDDKVKLRKTADEAKAHWRDEERSGALFGENGDKGGRDDRQDWRGEHNLNRSFSGTY
jgi:hypothetical protein